MTKPCSRPNCGRRNYSSRWQYCSHCRQIARETARRKAAGLEGYGGRKSSAVSPNAVPRLTDVIPCARCGERVTLAEAASHMKAGCWL